MRWLVLPRTPEIHPRHKQIGAAAIEFALLFLLFFTLFYALVSYAIAMMLQESFVHAAEEGARAAIAVDPLEFASTDEYRSAIATRVLGTVGDALSWLPAKAKSAVTGDNINLSWTGNALTVRVVYAGYASDPLLPVLNLPVVGNVPKLPADLVGAATIGL